MRHAFAALFLLYLSFISQAVVGADFAALYAAHSDSVVTISTVSSKGWGQSQKTESGIGSGVLINEKQILTAAHVVDGVQTIKVQFKNGDVIPATVVASLNASDVALLKLSRAYPEGTFATLANSDETPVGSEVFIIGSPFGISQTLSVGHLSGRMNRGLMAGGLPIEFLQTDTAINTGNSGGPMFNTDGEVIGIVSFILSKSGGFNGIGFATAINSARHALLSSSGVMAGFEGILLSEDTSKALNYPEPGLLVQRVNSESVLGKAGLVSGSIPAVIDGRSFLLGGDLIVAINGLVCKTPHDFTMIRSAMSELNEHDTYSVTIYRQGEKVDLIAGTPFKGLQEIPVSETK